MSLAYSWLTTIVATVLVGPFYMLGVIDSSSALMYFLVISSLLYAPVAISQVAGLVSSG